MEQVASWSPDGWEWVMGLARGDDGYVYVLADATLYTFDAVEAAGGDLWPVDADELETPGDCWWCGGPDWSFDVEVIGGHLYVGATSGVHVFSLEDPWAPEEVAHFVSHGPVLDMAHHRGRLYLADGWGITVVDVSDPVDPIEVGRVGTGMAVWTVGVNARDRAVMALSPTKLLRYDIRSFDRDPVKTGQIGLLGLLFYGMEVEDRWTYLSGLWTQTVFDDPLTGLSRKGPHGLREWVDGRVIDDGRALRLDLLGNELELWEEVE